MITLDRNSLTNLLKANESEFVNFPVINSYCSDSKHPESQVNFSTLIAEIDSNPEIREKIEQCARSPFQIETDNYDILNGLELVDVIRSNKVTISTGEETWISNLERVRDALNKGACCSTRAALRREAQSCYEDLVNQCNSSWIFVKNIKQSVGASELTLHYSDGRVKKV